MGFFRISEEEIEVIAERAATKAAAQVKSDFYQMVGKSVLEKIFYVVGAACVGLVGWLHGRGLL